MVWKYSEEFNRLWEDFAETEITEEKADQAVQEAIDRNKRTQEKRKATIARNKEAKRVKAEVEHKAREEIMKMLAHDLRKEFETQELLTDDKKHLASDIVHEVVKRNLAVQMKARFVEEEHITEVKKEGAVSIVHEIVKRNIAKDMKK